MLNFPPELVVDAVRFRMLIDRWVSGMADAVERAILGEWYIIADVVCFSSRYIGVSSHRKSEFVRESVVVSYQLWDARQSIPDGCVIVGVEENGGPYTRHGAEATLVLLENKSGPAKSV